MVISISGPSSTGKTTLIKALKQECTNCIFIDEVFRKIINQYNVDFNNAEEAFNFQCELCKHMTYQNMLNKTIILDRCNFDTIVYTTLHFLRLKEKEKYIIQYLNAVKYCEDSLSSINYIFLTQPYTINIENDGVRPQIYNILRQQEIDLFNKLYYSRQEYKPKLILLPFNLNMQIALIKDYIR